MYRPEGWENPHIRHTAGGVAYKSEYRVYEAGADALLEGLRRIDLEEAEYQVWAHKGYLVFIPEEG